MTGICVAVIKSPSVKSLFVPQSELLMQLILVHFHFPTK